MKTKAAKSAKKEPRRLLTVAESVKKFEEPGVVIADYNILINKPIKSGADRDQIKKIEMLYPHLKLKENKKPLIDPTNTDISEVIRKINELPNERKTGVRTSISLLQDVEEARKNGKKL